MSVVVGGAQEDFGTNASVFADDDRVGRTTKKKQNNNNSNKSPIRIIMTHPRRNIIIATFLVIRSGWEEGA